MKQPVFGGRLADLQFHKDNTSPESYNQHLEGSLGAERWLAIAVEALETAVSLLNEDVIDHRTDDNNNYNGCDKDPCMFCIKSAEVETALKDINAR